MFHMSPTASCNLPVTIAPFRVDMIRAGPRAKSFVYLLTVASFQRFRPVLRAKKSYHVDGKLKINEPGKSAVSSVAAFLVC